MKRRRKRRRKRRVEIGGGRGGGRGGRRLGEGRKGKKEDLRKEATTSALDFSISKV